MLSEQLLTNAVRTPFARSDSRNGTASSCSTARSCKRARSADTKESIREPSAGRPQPVSASSSTDPIEARPSMTCFAHRPTAASNTSWSTPTSSASDAVYRGKSTLRTVSKTSTRQAV